LSRTTATSYRAALRLRRAASPPGLVAELERQRLGLEPLLEDLLAAAARGDAGAVEVVEEVVHPVDPLLVPEPDHDPARLPRERGEHAQVLVLVGGEVERRDVVGDGAGLLLQHGRDGGDGLREAVDLRARAGR